MEKGVAAAAAALGAGYLFLVLRMPVGDVEDPVGPRMFPMLIAIGILIVSAFMWIEARAQPAIPKSGEADAVEASIRKQQRIGVAGVCLGAVLFVLLLEPLGFLPASLLLLLGMLWAFNPGKHVQNVSVAVGLSCALYFGLKHFLGVGLPAGVLSLVG